MTYFELCPVCFQLAKRIVDKALDFSEAVTLGEVPSLCTAHIPLVFSTLSYPTMARWLDAKLAELATGFSARECVLCAVETDVSIFTVERANSFLCSQHGGVAPATLTAIRQYLARIATGERFDKQRFVLRTALILLASVRGTAPMVRIE